MNTWQNHTNGAQHRATRICAMMVYRSGLGWNWQVTKQGSAQLLASGTSDTRKAAKEAAEYALLHYAPSADPKPLRIAFIGSAATGKTTLTRWVKKHYGLPMINEIARQVLGELETDFPTDRKSVV